MKISILVSALAFTAVFAEAEISSLRASSSRSLTEDSHHALPLVQPPMYLDTYVPCQRHAHDGKCGFWSLTENKYVICSDQLKCRHYPGCDPRGQCVEGQYCALLRDDRWYEEEHKDDSSSSSSSSSSGSDSSSRPTGARRHPQRPRRHHRRGGRGGRGRKHGNPHTTTTKEFSDSSMYDDSSSSSSSSSGSGRDRQLTAVSSSAHQGPWYWTHPWSGEKHQCDAERKFTYCQPCTLKCYTADEAWQNCQAKWPLAREW